MQKSRKDFTPVYLLSSDQSLTETLKELEMKFVGVDLLGINTITDPEINLIVDIESFNVQQISDAIKTLNGHIKSSLFLGGSETRIEERITLASAGVSYIGNKDNLVFELGKFARSELEQAKKLMVIDDSGTDLYAIEDALSGFDYEIHPFKDAMEAMNQIDVLQPDAVLIDIHMPEPLDGPTFVRTIRQMAKHASLPIIFVSGEERAEARINALETGGDDFLAKPINPNLTNRIIQKHLSRSEQQNDLINKDYLTKAYNRIYLNKTIEKYKSTKSPVACAILDIDHFKSINDTHGHDFGDHALQYLSGLLHRQLRSNDLVFRFGGEEFVLILDVESGMEACVIVDRLRRQLKNSTISKNGTSINMTFSAGVYFADTGDIDDGILKSDDLLYKAKRSGRNRVEI